VAGSLEMKRMFTPCSKESPPYLSTEVTMLGHPLPLGPRLNMIHPSNFCYKVRLSFTVIFLGFLQLRLIALVPINHSDETKVKV